MLTVTTASVALAQQPAQTGASASLPDGKFAVVDAEKFSDKIDELKQKYDQVEAQFKPRFEKIQQMAEQMKKLEAEIRAGLTTLPADKQRQMQLDYEDLKRRGTRDESDLHEEVSRALAAATRPINEKLSKALADYAKQRNIVAVFNLAALADTGLLAFFDPGSDITDDFIAQYNKANPVSGAAAPGAKAPAR
jgi:Skp family chaperone for outer membrane proteins